MEGFIAIALFIVVVQLILGLYQLRYYDRFVKQLVKKYDIKGYSLKSETVKKRFKTIIVVLVIDKDNIIVEAHEYNGVTIFTRFQPIDKIIGNVMDNRLYQELQQKEESLTNQAILKIMERDN